MQRLQEEKAKRDEKEREVQRLREKQEKVADRQAAIDEVKMRRAFDQAERDARLREKLANDKKQRLLKELEDARIEHIKYKENALAEQA